MAKSIIEMVTPIVMKEHLTYLKERVKTVCGKSLKDEEIAILDEKDVDVKDIILKPTYKIVRTGKREITKEMQKVLIDQVKTELELVKRGKII